MRPCATCCRTSRRPMTRSTARGCREASFCSARLDREESLIHLLRVNILKRMESAVTSFALTLKRQLADVEGDARPARCPRSGGGGDRRSKTSRSMTRPSRRLLIGREVKVLLQDVDRVRWRQDLIEDRNRLDTLLSAARQVIPARDDKLDRLRGRNSAQGPQPDQSRKPQDHRLYRLCRYGGVSLPRAGAVGAVESRPARALW